MSALVIAIDWAGKALTLLVLTCAALFVLWQCLEGMMKITTIGRGFFHYCRNRHIFERWLAEMREEEQERKAKKKPGGSGV